MKKIQSWLIILISSTFLVASILQTISSGKYYLFLFFIPYLIILPVVICYRLNNKTSKKISIKSI